MENSVTSFVMTLKMETEFDKYLVGLFDMKFIVSIWVTKSLSNSSTTKCLECEVLPIAVKIEN